jgi:hypothetical protein
MHGRRISRFRYRRRRPVNQRHLRGEQQPRRIIRDADQQQDEIAERLGEDDRVGFHSAHNQGLDGANDLQTDPAEAGVEQPVAEIVSVYTVVSKRVSSNRLTIP